MSSIGDLLERLIDGWQIERLHYADSCAPMGPPDAAGAFFELRRPDAGRRRVFVPDDGRTFAHRSLLEMFRERSHIWKHRDPSRFPDRPETPPGPPRLPDEWGEVPPDFPDGMRFTPATLRTVIGVNQDQSVDGVTLAVTALELHDHGMRVRLLAHADEIEARGDIEVLDAVAIDDGGRMYEVGQVVGERSGNRMDGLVILAPAPPPEAARLTVTIGTLGGDEVPTRGPWVFPIHLREVA